MSAENVIDIFTGQPYDAELTPEKKMQLAMRLAHIDMEIEPLQREAEAIRRKLGLLGLELGLGDGA